MFLTIREMLELKEFEKFEIKAGEKGLDNKVKKVGILDYERDELIEENFEPYEFALSTLLAIKNNLEELYEIVEKLIASNVSALAIKSIYFNELPRDVIELANRHAFPIFMFSEAFFENIITSVADAVKEKDEMDQLAMKVDKILNGNLNNLMIRKLAYEICKHFRERHVVGFCRKKETGDAFQTSFKALLHDKNLDKYHKLIPYNDGYIVILTYDELKEEDIFTIVSSRLESLGMDLERYNIGVSSLYNNLDEMHLSILEAVYAFKHARAYDNDMSHYRDIGTDRLLLPYLDSPWIKKYYDDFILPLIIYDGRNDTAFLETAIKFVEHNGDFKATAEDLFQHNNTIRYRVDRIKQLIAETCHTDHFFEELSMAVRIHNLMRLDL